MPDDAISMRDASEIAGVHYETIRAWIERGDVRAWKVGGQYRLSRSELERYLRGEQVAS